MSMTCRLVLDGSDDAASRPIDLRSSLNCSLTITVDDSVGNFTVEGTDDVQTVLTELDTGVDQSIVWADITAMADTSDSLSVSAPGAVVVTMFNTPAFIRVVFDHTSGSDPIVVAATGRG